MKKIVFTGGGTAGHVTPNIALMEKLHAEGGWEIHYIGTDSMEKELLAPLGWVTFHTISSGKFRRYFSLKNFTDPFRVLRGVLQSRRYIRQIRPDVIFSKGGFVSVPVVMASGKVPVVSHESDYTPGLANRIASRFCDHICVSFEDTLRYTKPGKGIHTGSPIRPELYGGDRERARAFTGLDGKKPVLMVMGGSLGSLKLNELVRNDLDALQETFDVIHLCGKDKEDPAFDGRPGYVQYEYISEELPDLFAFADMLISRAGANAVFEALALHKPTLLVPLTMASTRGDQLLNSEYFERKGYGLWVDQNAVTPEQFTAAVRKIWENREEYSRAMREETKADGTDAVLKVIRDAAGR